MINADESSWVFIIVHLVDGIWQQLHVSKATMTNSFMQWKGHVL